MRRELNRTSKSRSSKRPKVPRAGTMLVTGEGTILDYNPTFKKINGGPSARLGSGGNYVEDGSTPLLSKYQGAYSPV